MAHITSKIKVFLNLFVLSAIIVLGIYLLIPVSKDFYKTGYPQGYSQYVEKYSKQFGVDKNLVYAVIRTESSYKPNAVSNIGAKGLMQITEETFEWAKLRKNETTNISYDNIFEPETNIKYGTYILSLLLKEFKTKDTALAAYHAGWGNVKKWLADPQKSTNGIDIETVPFGNTKTYIKNVNSAVSVYVKLYN